MRQFEVQVLTSVTFTDKGKQGSVLDSTDVYLNLPIQFDKAAYYEGDQLSANGVQAVTSTLIEGLLANLHGAHINGTRDSAEHLRYIIDRLEQGFVRLVDADSIEQYSPK